jgi:hypothetical protein
LSSSLTFAPLSVTSPTSQISTSSPEPVTPTPSPNPALPHPIPSGHQEVPSAEMRSSIATYRESLSRLAGEVDDATADEVPAPSREGDQVLTPSSSGRRRRYSRPDPAEPDEVTDPCSAHPRFVLSQNGTNRGSDSSGSSRELMLFICEFKVVGLLDINSSAHASLIFECNSC